MGHRWIAAGSCSLHGERFPRLGTHFHVRLMKIRVNDHKRTLMELSLFTECSLSRLSPWVLADSLPCQNDAGGIIIKSALPPLRTDAHQESPRMAALFDVTHKNRSSISSSVTAAFLQATENAWFGDQWWNSRHVKRRFQHQRVCLCLR